MDIPSGLGLVAVPAFYILQIRKIIQTKSVKSSSVWSFWLLVFGNGMYAISSHINSKYWPLTTAFIFNMIASLIVIRLHCMYGGKQ